METEKSDYQGLVGRENRKRLIEGYEPTFFTFKNCILLGFIANWHIHWEINWNISYFIQYYFEGIANDLGVL